MLKDGVFVFTGFVPNNYLAPAVTRVQASDSMVTEAIHETGNPGIYLVGDLRVKYVKQIITAAADGCVAALAAAHSV